MTALRRTLGLSDAVVIGAGSMIGAGVFAAWAPAAEAAGTGLLVGLAIAAVVAFCNATSSAQLAALHPESGGTYVYGRRRLGPAWGHLAGWGFVVGKTASCAAVASTIGLYLWPERATSVGVAAIIGITAVNLGGLTRTAFVTRILLVVSLASLVVVVVAGWSGDVADIGRLTPVDGDVVGILRSAGLLFFAFAGYARIATLGEEVKDPERTIPRAIPRALAAVLVVYAVVAVTVLAVLPVSTLAESAAPLRAVVEMSPLDGLAPFVRIGAGIAALGVLLNLIPGVSRTVVAMAREAELPRSLAVVAPRLALPIRAELTVAVAAIGLVLVLDLRSSIAVSGVAVLTYYAITNAAALTLATDERRWPPALAVAGFVGCVVLAVSLPWSAVLGGVTALGVGVAVRVVLERRR